MNLSALLDPESVAVVGASADPAKTAGRPVRFLEHHGFKGEVWPINPGRDEVQGLPAFPDLKSLPGVPDQVFVALNTEPAMQAVEEAVEIGVQLVVVLASGFSEAGAEGRRREDRLREMVRGAETRLLGPNSLGLVRPSTGLTLTANAAFAADAIPSGPVSVISQSGSAIGTFVSRGRARGIGFANLVSVGNEADLSVGEIGRLLLRDDNTETFILFLESLKHTAQLEAFAEEANQAGKSIIAYKLGRSEVGAELAVSHTGALVSSDHAADAFFRDLGIHRMDVFEATFEGAPLFAPRWRDPSRPKPRVAVVSTTGGGGALVTDRLGLKDVEIAGPTDAVRERVAALGIALGDGALIDLTLAGTKPEIMRGAIEALLDDDHYDAIVAATGSSSEFFPELAVEPIVSAVNERSGALKPLAVFTVPHAERALALLAQAGIAGFRTPEACAEAVAARLHPAAPRFGRSKAFAAEGSAAAKIANAPDRLSEEEALDLFATLGIPTVARRFVSLRKLESLETAAAELSYPVVAKIVSRDLPHKSESGGVKTGLRSMDEIDAAIQEIFGSVTEKAPRAILDGILLQEQMDGVQEVILGLRRDPAVGSIVTLGVGGLFAEIYADITVRRAPVTVEEASEMIRQVRGLKISGGYRGRPKGDLKALAETISAFSGIGAHDRVLEAEINPLIVGREGEGVCAVDGLARFSSREKVTIDA